MIHPEDYIGLRGLIDAYEQSAAIKKTVVENATRERVLEHACELVETFPVSKEKALILFVIRSWDFL